MPEGPEVLSIVKYLNKNLKNSQLKEIKVHSGRYKRKKIENLSKLPLPIKIKSVNCKGKFIWFELGNDWTIWNTLGLTGDWLDAEEKHNHVELVTSKGSYYFNDPRNFGTFKINNKSSELEKKLNYLGLDLLNDTKITNQMFLDVMRKHNDRTLAYVLMKQNIIAGIGVYLRSEILYRCKLDPFKKIRGRSDDILIRLFECARTLMRGIKDTRYGDFDFSVYQRNEDPKGNTIKKEIGPHKRAIYWVPSLQKL